MVPKPDLINRAGPPEEARPHDTVLAALQQRGDRLDLRVVIEDVVAHFPTPARLLVAAEWQRSVEDVVAVDPHGAGADLLGERVRLGDIAGPYSGAKPVRGVVGLCGDLVEAAELLGDDHGPEDLLADDLHVWSGVGEDGGLDEVAPVAEPAPAGQGRGTLGLAGLKEAGDAAELLV